jgi:hypothetical protein
MWYWDYEAYLLLSVACCLYVYMFTTPYWTDKNKTYAWSTSCQELVNFQNTQTTQLLCRLIYMRVPYPKLPFVFWSPGVKWGRREADHKSPFFAEVKNDWSYSSTHLHTIMACSGTIMLIVCIVEYNSHWTSLRVFYFHLCFNNCISQVLNLSHNNNRE